MPLEIPAGQCSPVSVLDRKVLLHSFHQVPETLGKDFLLGERLAVDQACSQFTEILLGERQCQLGSNSKPRRKPGQLGSTCAPWYSGVCIHTELSILRENLSCFLDVPSVIPALKSLLLWLLHCYCLAWWSPCLLCGRLVFCVRPWSSGVSALLVTERLKEGPQAEEDLT